MQKLQWTQKRRRRTDEELTNIEEQNFAGRQAWEEIEKKRHPPLPEKQKISPIVQVKEQVKGLGHFVEATEKAFATLDTSAAHKTSAVVFRCCSQVTTKLLALIQSGGLIDETTACLYRDTTVRMGVLLSEKRAVEKLELKSTVKTMNQLGQLMKISCTKAGFPVALSDPVLQCTWLDLKNYVDSHRDDALLRMQEYVHAFQQQNKQGSLKRLLEDFLEGMISYRKREATGPLRSEENWNIFAEVGKALADWIGSTTTLSVNENKRMRIMFHELKIFDATFPDRVPPYLFQNARIQDRLCRSQHKYEKEIRALGNILNIWEQAPVNRS